MSGYLSDTLVADIANGAVGYSTDEVVALAREVMRRREAAPPYGAIPMRIVCPECKTLHVDEGEFATKIHHTHSCQSCGLTWRPAVVATVGVRFLPGFKNEEETP